MAVQLFIEIIISHNSLSDVQHDQHHVGRKPRKYRGCGKFIFVQWVMKNEKNNTLHFFCLLAIPWVVG